MICTNCGHENELPEIVLPDWYEILLELSTRKKLSGLPPYEFAKRYVDEYLHGLNYEELMDVAIAVDSQWGGKGWKYSNLWRVFQNWGRHQARRAKTEKAKSASSIY